MQRRILWIAVAVVVIGLAAVFYPRRATDLPPVPVDLPEPPTADDPAFDPAAPPAEPEPAPAFVAEEAEDAPAPLPTLDDSDEAARAALVEVAGETLVERYLVSDALIRKLVATVDNLPREALWIKSRVVPPVEGRFLAEGPEDAPVTSPANHARYAPLAQLVGALDAAALAAAYQRHYPLLQEAYEELGYPGRQFHNRALEVIDHLLETPRVAEPIRLAQPHVRYTFADPALEALSPGQKVLLRIGPDNAGIIRAKLIELRAALEDLSAAVPAE
jgi:hypothetical protein